MDEDVSRFDLPPTTRRIRSAGRRGERNAAIARERWHVRNPAPGGQVPDAPNPQLAAARARHARELAAGTPHYQQTMHANDRPHPLWLLMVRLDDGGPGVPRRERRYAEVRAGYGEGARVKRAKAGKR